MPGNQLSHDRYLSNIASKQRSADKDVRNIGNSPYGGGHQPLNTKDGCVQHSLQRHTGNNVRRCSKILGFVFAQADLRCECSNHERGLVSMNVLFHVPCQYSRAYTTCFINPENGMIGRSWPYRTFIAVHLVVLIVCIASVDRHANSRKAVRRPFTTMSGTWNAPLHFTICPYVYRCSLGLRVMAVSINKELT